MKANIYMAILLMNSFIFKLSVADQEDEGVEAEVVSPDNYRIPENMKMSEVEKQAMSMMKIGAMTLLHEAERRERRRLTGMQVVSVEVGSDGQFAQVNDEFDELSVLKGILNSLDDLEANTEKRRKLSTATRSVRAKQATIAGQEFLSDDDKKRAEQQEKWQSWTVNTRVLVKSDGSDPRWGSIAVYSPPDNPYNDAYTPMHRPNTWFTLGIGGKEWFFVHFEPSSAEVTRKWVRATDIKEAVAIGSMVFVFQTTNPGLQPFDVGQVKQTLADAFVVVTFAAGPNIGKDITFPPEQVKLIKIGDGNLRAGVSGSDYTNKVIICERGKKMNPWQLKPNARGKDRVYQIYGSFGNQKGWFDVNQMKYNYK